MKKTVLDLIPEHIRALVGYVPGKAIRQAHRESGIAMVKLASNENPFGPSPRAIEAIRAAAASVNLYPDNDATELRLELATRHHLAPEQVFLAAGSLGILDILARTLLAPGLNCITSDRSFISYTIVTQATGARLITPPMRDHTYDLDAIAAAINDETRLVILANPNNPTGTMFDADAFDAFLDRIPDHVLVVLDEAYCDFAESFAAQRGIAYSRSMECVHAARPNLIVLRTFSKAHGLAGLRVGYGCGQAELLPYFTRVRNAFSVSAVAEAGALAAMQDDAHIRKTVQNNLAGAAWLLQHLAELGIHAVPTSANFIYFETDEHSSVLARRVQADGVIVRPLVAWGIPNGVRVTIGTPEENELFLRALKKTVGQTVAP
ncbi:MAG TPA: histidinol-phosphate transaminase [Verrucomicrobiae bacterium]|jgi:histidinol-phosphate aminotransferase|nr:histidinol-phosphate transaminase [Verrucomicrobiae bacterium]